MSGIFNRPRSKRRTTIPPTNPPVSTDMPEPSCALDRPRTSRSRFLLLRAAAHCPYSSYWTADMSYSFGYQSLVKLVTTLLDKTTVTFDSSTALRDWKRGVLSVASSDWLDRLRQGLSNAEYKERIQALKTRIKRDASKMQAYAYNTDFPRFVLDLVGRFFSTCPGLIRSLKSPTSRWARATHSLPRPRNSATSTAAASSTSVKGFVRPQILFETAPSPLSSMSRTGNHRGSHLVPRRHPGAESQRAEDLASRDARGTQRTVALLAITRTQPHPRTRFPCLPSSSGVQAQAELVFRHSSPACGASVLGHACYGH